MSRTHFKQGVGDLINYQISTSESSKPIKPKSKLKTKMGLVEVGAITIRGTTTRILVFRANQGT
jgi:hypothetical protein